MRKGGRMYITFWCPDIIPIAIMRILSVLLIITAIEKWGFYPLPKCFRLLTKRIKFGKPMGCVAGHTSENLKPQPKVGYLKNYKG